MKLNISSRIVEAYVGEYAGGKSEVLVNRALMLSREGRTVSLVEGNNSSQETGVRRRKG